MRRGSQILLGLALTALSVGCARTRPIDLNDEALSSGPPPLRSEEILVAVFGSGATAPQGTTATAAGFGPTLTAEQALETAYRRNPTFEEFEANLDAARAEVMQAVAYPNPSIEAEAGVAFSRDEAKSVGEYGIGISQPIEWPAKREARRAAALASKDVVEREREAFRARLRGEVLKACYTALYHARAADVARETLRIAREIEAIVKRRVEYGEAPGVEQLRAEVEARQAARAVERELRRLAAWRAVLNTLAGRELPADFVLSGSLHREMSPADLEPAQRIAASQHPSLRRLDEVLARQRLIVEREKKAWYPDLVPSLGISREIDSVKAGGGLGIDLLLWNRNQGGIAAAEAELRRLEAERERTRQEVSREVEVEYENYMSAREQLGALEKGLRAAAAETLKIETFRYELGESSLLELLDARRTAQQTEGEFIQALYDANAARTDLERAIGIGGEEQ